MSAHADTRHCERCGEPFTRSSYGWRYGRFCSWKCTHRQTVKPCDGDREKDHRDCVHYKSCVSRAGLAGDAYACRFDCENYTSKPQERAHAELSSPAWMWAEA